MNENTTTKGEKMEKETERLIGRCKAELDIEGVLDEARTLKLIDALEAAQAHIARLEARVGELEAELKDIRDATAWLSNVDPDEIKDEELHCAALIDFRRWERVSRQPGAVGNRVYHFEDFLVTHAREQGRRAALVEGQAAAQGVVPDDAGCFTIAHDGLLLIGSEKARSEGHNVVGAYFDRLGNLQEIRTGSLYDGYLQTRRSALPASRALKEGEAVVSQAYLDAIENAANQFCGSCRDKGSCSLGMMAIGKGCGAWRLDAARINALRTQATEGVALTSEEQARVDAYRKAVRQS